VEIDECVVLPHMSSSLIYNGVGPPPLRRRGCAVLVGTAGRGRGRRDLEGSPLLCETQASVMVGGVLHPRQLREASSFLGYDRRWPDLEQQAAAYTRGRSTTVGLMNFLLLKIEFWCRLI
jgi:hypothetical protein